MAKKPNQKLKLIYIAKILLEQTDEENALTVSEIQAELANYGVSAERKTVYSDIEMLKMVGIDIAARKSRTTQYFVASRPFELAELKLLVDAVQCSKFITHKKSRELIIKLEKLAGREQAKQLRRQVYIDSRVKTVNESIYYNVDTLHSAIANDKKVTFKYFDYNTNKEKIYRKNKHTYNESPYGMLWEDDKYYLVTYSNKYGNFVHYRVDRMKDIELTSEKRNPLPPSMQFDMAQYSNKMFSMHSGEEHIVRLKCKNSLVNAIIDKFGNDIEMEKLDEENFCITPKLQVSTNFFAWLFKFGSDIKIISPEDTAANYREYIKKVLSEYE
ncbi:helix-turn-helix transcriptional regulator [Proteocatella sphenisci]|uniref:helix-turn-helix transcriptional regulator n=1 Tax=Proteocatella sphenisci TaxID=181070 RepID=UPI00048EF977|nr:WYL domain-containing transcriptional regulator [Proteocatella sphenisci]